VRRVPGVLLVLIALVAFVAAGYVLAHDQPVKNAGEMPAGPPSSSTSSPATASSSLSSSGATTTKPVVAFLGDDWTAGLGATTKRKRFTSLVAGALNLRERNFGADRSGYAATSSSGKDYDGMVADLVAAKPQYVVVGGGRNDVVEDDLSTATANAATLFQTLHRKLPDATLVAVAPTWGDSDPPAALADLARAVKKAVTAVGGTYLDIRDAVRGHPDYMADDADPNNAGYAALARVLEPRLRPLVAA
jgi:lysophospholipase L1-like esterase